MLTNTFDILRRSHLLLSVVGLAVFLIALPVGNNLNSGLNQLRTLSTFLNQESYLQECAEAAAEVYQNFWDDVITSQPVDIATSIPQDGRYGGFVICDKPGDEATLNEYVDYLSSTLSVGLGHVEPSAVYNGLDDVYFTDMQLLGITVASRQLAESNNTYIIPSGQDSLALSLYSAPLKSSSTLPKDSLYLIFKFLWEDEGTISVNHDITHSRMTLEREITPVQWFDQNGQDAGILAKSSRDGLIYLHHVRPFWQEVSTMTISEAIRYLQARADQQKGNIAVLGLEINVNLLGWGGPLLILAMLSNLYVYLLHATRLVQAGEGNVETYPWVGFFPDASSAFLRVCSILIIPLLACIAVTIRSAPSSLPAAIWGGTVAIVVAAIGTMVLIKLRSIR